MATITVFQQKITCAAESLRGRNLIELCTKHFRLGYWKPENSPYICPLLRAHSSAGSEHLPYKQGVRGSNPCAPTSK
jgi:hypothetical protein